MVDEDVMDEDVMDEDVMVVEVGLDVGEELLGL